MQFGLPVVLFIVFLILKLTATIAWSWWWVTSPLWIAAIIAVVFSIFVGRKIRKIWKEAKSF
jgi:hypothetical protein